MMIFKEVNFAEATKALKAKQESRARKGSLLSSSKTLTIPYFKGIVRKGTERILFTVQPAKVKTLCNMKGVKIGDYDPKCEKQEKMIEEKKAKLINKGADIIINFAEEADLTSAFLMTYCTCLAYCEAKASNQVLSLYFVQVTLESYCQFAPEDYKQGANREIKAILHHLKEVSKERGLGLSFNAEGVILGMTDEIADSVLSAF